MKGTVLSSQMDRLSGLVRQFLEDTEPGPGSVQPAEGSVVGLAEGTLTQPAWAWRLLAFGMRGSRERFTLQRGPEGPRAATAGCHLHPSTDYCATSAPRPDSGFTQRRRHWQPVAAAPGAGAVAGSKPQLGQLGRGSEPWACCSSGGLTWV